MNRKSLFFLLLFSLMLVSPVLAQDTALEATYTSENGTLTLSHPDGWGIDDQDTDIFFSPDIEGVEIIFRLLNEVVQNALGINHDMTAEEAMQVFISAIPVDPPLTNDDISLSEQGENNVASIELILGEFTLASIVETPGGLVMVQAVGTEDGVDAARDIYFAMIASTVIDLAPLAEEDVAPDVVEDDSVAEIELAATFVDDNLPVTFNYPEEWQVNNDSGEVYLIPGGDAYQAIEGITFTILTVNDEVQEEFGITVDMSAEEAMQRVIDNASEQGIELTYDDIVLAEYGDNVGASVEIVIEPGHILATVVQTPGGLAMVQIIGDEDQVNAVRDVYFEIISTVSINAGDTIAEDDSDEEMEEDSEPVSVELSETFTDKDSGLTFSYPDGWDIDDEDASITLSNDDFVSIIEFEFWTEDVEDQFGIPEDTSAGDAAIAIANFVEDAGIEAELTKTTVGDYLVASVSFTDPSDGASLISGFVQTDEGVILVRMASTEDEFDVITDIYSAMIESLEYHP